MAMTRDTIAGSGSAPRPEPKPKRPRLGSPPRRLPLRTARLAVALLLRPAAALHHQLVRTIGVRQSECVYHNFNKGDFATFEVFVIDAAEGGRPQAGVMIEGPIASPTIGKIDETTGERTWDDRPRDDRIERGAMGRMVGGKMKMGAVLQDWIVNWPAYVRKNRNRFQEVGIIHHAFHIDYTHSGEEEDAVAARADLSRQRNELEEERRKRKQEMIEARQTGFDHENYEDEGQRIEQILPDWVEPYEWTKPIKAPGWYRMCVQADNEIDVEMDIRSSADMGGINPDRFHVYTHDEREEIDEEERWVGKRNRELAEEEEAKLLAKELEKMLKGQVKDYDLQTTRKLMNEVNKLVSQMVRKQQDAHRRIKKHEDDAARNRRKIMRSGIIETVLYLAITLFQVYTIHNWLLSSNMLGR